MTIASGAERVLRLDRLETRTRRTLALPPELIRQSACGYSLPPGPDAELGAVA
jgi:hypothetical protein